MQGSATGVGPVVLLVHTVQVLRLFVQTVQGESDQSTWGWSELNRTAVVAAVGPCPPTIPRGFEDPGVPMSSTPTKSSPLSRRVFTVSLVPAGPTPVHSRHLKRIHVAAEILKAAKICAGDALVVRAVDTTEGIEGLSLEDAAPVRAFFFLHEGDWRRS